MLKKVVLTIVLGLLISYPLAAAPFEGLDLAKPAKLATLRIAVDQETGVIHTELLGPELGGDKVHGPGTYMDRPLYPPIRLHVMDPSDGYATICPTCDNCPEIGCSEPPCEGADRGEILFLCLCFDPATADPVQPMDTMVLPTAGQKYGLELVPYTPHLHGSATAATAEVVCAQQPPDKGYEFDYWQHCGVAISVTVSDCGSFEVWYDVLGTVWTPP